ncbi:phasin family protein [Marivita sp.]|uniref:phasin family protein n=1 Tax=Marivita sp. TaxID=2003365 RepID=UPI0025BC6FA2|nr:phasin family protein [Marivita sp.]
MAKDQPKTDIGDLSRQTQALFDLNGVAAPQLEQVMKVQEGMLEQAETFTRHWVERRQKAVETAVETLNEMNSSGKPDPMAAMQAIAEWQRGSLERLTEDYREWMTLCMQATQLAATPQDETEQDDAASDDTAEDKAATKSKGRAAASRSKSEHATPV